MSEPECRPVRLAGHDGWYCARCGVRWPCLRSHERALERVRQAKPRS